MPGAGPDWVRLLVPFTLQSWAGPSAQAPGFSRVTPTDTIGYPESFLLAEGAEDDCLATPFQAFRIFPSGKQNTQIVGSFRK